jgi:methylated-DNA-protein-cysteine methyltransferase related protein
MVAPSRYQCIYRVVRQIPRGRVATYGQIADLAGLAGHARQVGYALHALDDGAHAGKAVPWHRVINAQGRISLRGDYAGDIQRQLLEREGVELDARERIDLKRFRWRPRTRRV